MVVYHKKNWKNIGRISLAWKVMTVLISQIQIEYFRPPISSKIEVSIENDIVEVETVATTNSDSNHKKNVKKKVPRVRIVWKKKGLCLIKQQLEFHDDTNLNEELLALETPYQFFTFFFTEEIFTKITGETNSSLE